MLVNHVNKRGTSGYILSYSSLSSFYYTMLSDIIILTLYITITVRLADVAYLNKDY